MDPYISRDPYDTYRVTQSKVPTPPPVHLGQATALYGYASLVLIIVEYFCTMCTELMNFWTLSLSPSLHTVRSGLPQCHWISHKAKPA